jgi:glycosyltransferase involved in cell wall biosynthesis
MRVLYVFPHPLGGSGIGSVAWHHVDELARAGVDVTVVTTRLARRFEPVLPVRVTSVLGPVRPRMIGVDRAHALVDGVAARLVARRPPDVVHVWPGAVLRTAAAARRAGVVSFREAPSPYTRVAVAQAEAAWHAVGLELPKGHFHNLREQVLLAEDAEFRAVNVVLTGSPESAATFGQAPFPVVVAVARYGFDPARFRLRPHGSLPRTVAFVGRGEPAKGIHVLLRAWSRAERPAGTRLIIAGTMIPQVRRMLANELQTPGVEVRGWVADAPAVLANSDVMALPSFSEGSALVTYEALGAGVVPLVSTRAGSPVVDGHDGLVHEAGDVDTLADHLERVLGEGDEWSALRSRGELSRSQWTWRAAGRRLLDVYLEVTEGSPRQAARQDR